MFRNYHHYLSDDDDDGDDAGDDADDADDADDDDDPDDDPEDRDYRGDDGEYEDGSLFLSHTSSYCICNCYVQCKIKLIQSATAEVRIVHNRGTSTPITIVTPRYKMRIPMGGFVRHRGEAHPSQMVT